MDKIEFYVRHNSNGSMLNIYMSPEAKKFLLKALLETGKVDSEQVEMSVELNVQQEWVCNPDNPNYLRIPVSLLNFQELE